MIDHFTSLKVIVSCTLMTSTAAANWTQFQGDSAHTAYAPGVYTPTSYRQLWHTSLYSPRELVTLGDAIFLTHAGGMVSRLDRYAGSLQWSVNLPYDSHNGITAPAVAGDAVYVHRFGHSSSSGSTEPEDKPALLGLDAASGVIRFTTQHSGQWNSGSRPTVDGDAVFAAGGYYGGLDAYRLDGVHRWFADVNQQYGWVPAADQDHVYVYMGEASASPGPGVGKLYIFDRASGQRTEIRHPRSTGTRSRTSDDGSVMLDGVGNAYALSWISGGNYGSTLVSFNLSSRTINWEADGHWANNPATHNGLIALPENLSAVFLDAATGTRLWSWNHTSGVHHIVLTDKLAFVNTASGVHAVDLQTRSSIWNTSITGVLAADDGVLYITNSDGVYAFGVPEPKTTALAALTAIALAAGGPGCRPRLPESR